MTLFINGSIDFSSDAFDVVGHAAFDGFGLLIAEAEASLQNVCELAAADRYVACESDVVPLTIFTFIVEAPILSKVTTCESSGK